MNNIRIQELHRLLIKKRQELIKQLANEIATWKTSQKNPEKMKLDTENFGDNNVSPQIELERIENHEKCLRKYDEALNRISDGTYGICEECGEEIPFGRLKAVPFANLCVSCKSEKEGRKRVYTSQYASHRSDRVGANVYA